MKLIDIEFPSPQKYPIILGFATGNPPYKVSQQQAADIAEKAPAAKEVKPLIQRIYANGKISFRYSHSFPRFFE